jgi:hypothetical protein
MADDEVAAFLSACREGVAACEAFAAAHPRFDVNAPSYSPAWLQATRQGYSGEVLQWLLARGADVTMQAGRLSGTWHAFRSDNAATLRAVVAAREARAPHLSPLHLAALVDDDGSAVRRAMAAAAAAGDVNAGVTATAPAEDGHALPLHFALHCRNWAGALMMLSRNARARCAPVLATSPNNPVSQAVRLRAPAEVLTALLRPTGPLSGRCVVDVRCELDPGTPLEVALRGGMAGAALALIAAGASCGVHALEVAAARGQADVVRAIVQANPGACGGGGAEHSSGSCE